MSTGTTALEAARAELARLERQDFFNECSDNWYYSNGGKARMAKKIKEARVKVAELEMELAAEVVAPPAAA